MPEYCSVPLPLSTPVAEPLWAQSETTESEWGAGQKPGPASGPANGGRFSSSLLFSPDLPESLWLMESISFHLSLHSCCYSQWASYRQGKISSYKIIFSITLYVPMWNIKHLFQRHTAHFGDILLAQVVPMDDASKSSSFHASWQSNCTVQRDTTIRCWQDLGNKQLGLLTFLISCFPSVPGTQYFRKIIHSP